MNKTQEALEKPQPYRFFSLSRMTIFSIVRNQVQSAENHRGRRPTEHKRHGAQEKIGAHHNFSRIRQRMHECFRQDRQSNDQRCSPSNLPAALAHKPEFKGNVICLQTGTYGDQGIAAFTRKPHKANQHQNVMKNEQGIEGVAQTMMK